MGSQNGSRVAAIPERLNGKRDVEHGIFLLAHARNNGDLSKEQECKLMQLLPLVRRRLQEETSMPENVIDGRVNNHRRILFASGACIDPSELVKEVEAYTASTRTTAA